MGISKTITDLSLLTTHLIFILQMGDLEAVKCLSVFDADMNALNLQKKTPLDLLENPSNATLQGSTSEKEPTEHEAMSPILAQTPPGETKESDETHVSSTESSGQEIAAFLEICGAKQGKDIAARIFLQDSIDASPSSEDSDLLARAFTDINTTLDQRLREAGLSEKEEPGTSKYLGLLSHELDRLRKGGSRVLCMDGGGIRGLIQMELLTQLERLTGKKVTELFDWIVGTSTGGIVALGLVYGKSVYL